MLKTCRLRIFFITCFIALMLNGCSVTKIDVKNNKVFPIKLVKEKPSPTVLIAHGCGGWRDRSYAQWAKHFSDNGYNAIVVDSFEFREYKNLCNKGYFVPPSLRADDFEAVAIWVKDQPWHKGGIAVIGFSHGGSTALNIANNSSVVNIDAAISFYPYCGKMNGADFIGESIDNPRIPTQVHLGDADDWTPPILCGRMEKYAVYHYPDATHAFDMSLPDRKPHGYVLRYNKEAADLSRSRVDEFLKTTFQSK
jgi:dienelactone hydrolase